MRMILLATTLMLLAMTLALAGCGDEESTTVEDDSSITTVESSKTDEVETTSDVPTDFDFQAAGRKYVDGAASGDCEVAAELYGYTSASPSNSKDVVISNCEKITAELAALGEPTATMARQEGQPDGDVTVWVTREHADGSQWEMMLVFRDKADKGWVVNNSSYGMKEQAE